MRPWASGSASAARARTTSRTSTSTSRATAGGDHRPVGLGQVLARLRHAVCGRPAPLRREPVGLRAAVPAADGQAGRGRDRGPVARDLDRAEGHLPQPALHRRHGHRDPRLPAPAVRARRHALLPEPRHPAAVADRQQMVDAVLALPGRHAPDGAPGAGGARPQGRVRRAVRRDAGPGLRALPGRRPGRSSSTTCPS